MLQTEIKPNLHHSLQANLKEQIALQHFKQSLWAFSQLVMQLLKQKFTG